MQVHPSLLPRWRWLALIPALCSLSCSGSGLNPVKGQVFHNKQPAKGAVVTFHPKGGDDLKTIRPVGLTDDEGYFTLTTGDKPGAAAGEYVVTVIWPEEVKAKGFSTEGSDSRDRLQGAYANPKAPSAFKVEIKKGDNQLEPFHLK